MSGAKVFLGYVLTLGFYKLKRVRFSEIQCIVSASCGCEFKFIEIKINIHVYEGLLLTDHRKISNNTYGHI